MTEDESNGVSMKTRIIALLASNTIICAVIIVKIAINIEWVYRHILYRNRPIYWASYWLFIILTSLTYLKIKRISWRYIMYGILFGWASGICASVIYIVASIMTSSRHLANMELEGFIKYPLRILDQSLYFLLCFGICGNMLSLMVYYFMLY